MKFPKDAPKQKVIKTLESLGFTIVRIGTHISMIRENPEGTKIPLTMPNHDTIKGSTLRVICRQSGIKRNVFWKNTKKRSFLFFKTKILLQYLSCSMEQLLV